MQSAINFIQYIFNSDLVFCFIECVFMYSLFYSWHNLFKFSSGFLSIKNVVIITLWMPLFTYCIICFICVSVFIHWFFPASFHFIVFFSCFTACFVFGGSRPYIVNSTWLNIGYFNVSIDEHVLFSFFFPSEMQLSHLETV